MVVSTYPNDQPDGPDRQIQADAWRWQLGYVLATQGGIQRVRDHYLVPSQSGAGHYVVAAGGAPSCTCPDFELRRRLCKHLHAVNFFINVGPNALATAAPSASLLSMTPPATPRDWSAYNRAQTNEIRHFVWLLRSLCDGVPDLPAAPVGRPRLPMGDVVFSLTLKAYYNLPARRVISALDEAHARGLLSQVPAFPSLYQYLENPRMTYILRDLVEASALPLKPVEIRFAADSTWFPEAPGDRPRTRDRRARIKAHASCGTRTNIITAISITPYNSGDSPRFKTLLGVTAKNFDVREISADKAYLSAQNLLAADRLGATAYIPFKSNSRRIPQNQERDAVLVWERMFHYYHFNRERFLAHYHLRSNIETAFSMVKRRYGHRLRSRTPAARVNEVMLRFLAHNICCLVRSAYELDIQPLLDE